MADHCSSSCSPNDSEDPWGCQDSEELLAALPGLLRSHDPTDALVLLSELVDAADDRETAAVLGEWARSTEVLETVVACLGAWAPPQAHMPALMVLGNLCSNAFEESSQASKELVRAAGGLELVVAHCESEDASTQMYALGTALNLCSDAGCVEPIARLRPRLLTLAEGGGTAGEEEDGGTAARIAHYANGLLSNLAKCEELLQQAEAGHRRERVARWRRQQAGRPPAAADKSHRTAQRISDALWSSPLPEAKLPPQPAECKLPASSADAQPPPAADLGPPPCPLTANVCGRPPRLSDVAIPPEDGAAPGSPSSISPCREWNSAQWSPWAQCRPKPPRRPSRLTL